MITAKVITGEQIDRYRDHTHQLIHDALHNVDQADKTYRETVGALASRVTAQQIDYETEKLKARRRSKMTAQEIRVLQRSEAERKFEMENLKEKVERRFGNGFIEAITPIKEKHPQLYMELKSIIDEAKEEFDNYPRGSVNASKIHSANLAARLTAVLKQALTDLLPKTHTAAS